MRKKWLGLREMAGNEIEVLGTRLGSLEHEAGSPQAGIVEAYSTSEI